MVITGQGLVGIGTASPAEILHLSKDGALGVRIERTGGSASVGQIYNGGNLLTLSYNLNAITFNTGATPTERMRIDSSGNLLVATTSASASNTGDGFVVSGANGSLTSRRTTGASQTHAVFVNGGATVGSIVTSTVATLYNVSSDARLKDNIADADNASSLIDALQVRKFDWKADGSHQRYGFVAQELIEVAPEAVSVPQDEDEMMGVDYSKLVPMLVKELQSVRARLAQLEGN
jgi:hypothetical protein